jgi:hypothetical protein
MLYLKFSSVPAAEQVRSLPAVEAKTNKLKRVKCFIEDIELDNNMYTRLDYFGGVFCIRTSKAHWACLPKC